MLKKHFWQCNTAFRYSAVRIDVISEADQIQSIFVACTTRSAGKRWPFHCRVHKALRNVYFDGLTWRQFDMKTSATWYSCWDRRAPPRPSTPVFYADLKVQPLYMSGRVSRTTKMMWSFTRAHQLWGAFIMYKYFTYLTYIYKNQKTLYYHSHTFVQIWLHVLCIITIIRAICHFFPQSHEGLKKNSDIDLLNNTQAFFFFFFFAVIPQMWLSDSLKCHLGTETINYT